MKEIRAHQYADEVDEETSDSHVRETRLVVPASCLVRLEDADGEPEVMDG